MSHQSRTRMADLATHAGVSIATVSRVLSGKAGVSESTRSSVLSSLEALGYARDRANNKPTGMVAILTPELSNPSFPAFAEELDALLFSAGWPNMLCAAGASGTGELQYLESLQEMPIAGAISVSGIPADTLSPTLAYQRLIDSGVPTVFINGYSPELAGASFSCSDAEAIAASVAHLRSLGHESIGLAIGQQRYLPTQRKIAAFKSLGFTTNDVATTVFTVEGGQLAASRLLDSGHTAIICGSDIMALGVIREARSRGLEVPRELSVIGFDDSPLMAFTDPALTTIRQPVRALCEAAVAALLGAIAGEPLEAAEMLFHPDLIIRNSTAPLR